MTDPNSVIPLDRLPAAFADHVRHPPEVPATPRPAATIVLMRDGVDGLEVLLLRRTRDAGFVPGAYVFPGGRVDASDAHPSLAQRTDDLTGAQAAARLGLEDEVVAMGYYVAALREAFEETGILVGRRADGSAPPTAASDRAVDAVRDDLLEDRITFAQALDRMGCRLTGGAVAYLAHWITPVVEPRRYDTRFFAASVPNASRPVVDPREMTDAVWLTPALALTRGRAGTLPMVFPTIKTLQQLAAYGDVESALEELRTQAVSTVLPRLVLTPEGLVMNVPEIVDP